MAEKDMTEIKLIGSRIREVRVSKGMSQSDLAAAANVSLPHISDIELGKVEMRLSTFLRITEALQVSSNVLIRPDVPEVKSIYQNQVTELLENFTPSEMESVIKILNEIKATVQKKEQEY